MLARSPPLALGLADLHQPALDRREPLIDVVFERRLHNRLTVTADERKQLHPFLPGLILRRRVAPPAATVSLPDSLQPRLAVPVCRKSLNLGPVPEAPPVQPIFILDPYGLGPATPMFRTVRTARFVRSGRGSKGAGGGTEEER